MKGFSKFLLSRDGGLWLVLLCVVIMSFIALVAFMPNQLVPVPADAPYIGPPDPQHSIVSLLFGFAVMSVVMAFFIRPPWPPRYWWRFILNCCATPAVLNALAYGKFTMIR